METDEEALYSLAANGINIGSITKYIPEAIAGMAGAGGGYMLTRKPVFGIVGAIVSVLTVSAVKALLVKQKVYSDTCGVLPTELGEYCRNWWKCAYGVGESKGICTGVWSDWGIFAVPNDVVAIEGEMPYREQQRYNQDGDYINIWMGVSPELYLGRFKWTC